MFTQGTLVALPCRISRGGFSSERVFRMTLAAGEEHVGAAPVDYFFDAGRKHLPPDEPPRGTAVGGYLTGRVIGVESPTVSLVSVPSGEVLRVRAGDISDLPRTKDGLTLVPLQP